MSRVPSLSVSNFSNRALAAFLASARSTVPSLSVSNFATRDGFLAKALYAPPKPTRPAMAARSALRREIMANPRDDELLLWSSTPMTKILQVASRHVAGFSAVFAACQILFSDRKHRARLDFDVRHGTRAARHVCKFGVIDT